MDRLFLDEKLFKQASGFAQPFFRQPHGFRFAGRIRDKSLFMEPTHRVPIKALPNSVIMKREIKKRENRLIDFFRIEFHLSHYFKPKEMRVN
jgi:hypothetical protein